MKIKLKGELDYELLHLGLMPGSIVEATADSMSTVGCMHFDIGNCCCSVWPENYTDDLQYCEVGMSVSVMHDGAVKRGVIVRIISDLVHVALINEPKGRVQVSAAEILPNDFKIREPKTTTL